jgi:hypothetical protein
MIDKYKQLLHYWTLGRAEIKQYYSDKDTAYSFYSNGRFVLVFNPTNHYREWLENLLFFTKKSQYGTAYSYRNASKEFLPQVLQDYDGKSDIEIIGASRGGAIGVDMYFRLTERFSGVDIHITTFGCPPVGRRAFREYAEEINMKHTRVVNKYDCVPRLPKNGLHYENDLILLDNSRRSELPFWRRGFTLCKNAHLGYGTDLQTLIIELENRDETFKNS